MNRLSRFHAAQEYDYATALGEVRRGHKVTHWIWYIFPQHRALGRSSTSDFYGIDDLDEAREYLHDAVLGGRLEEITRELLALKAHDPDVTAQAVFGRDAVKVRSCMTLFAVAEGGRDSVYRQVLRTYYDGRADKRTLELVNVPTTWRP